MTKRPNPQKPKKDPWTYQEKQARDFQMKKNMDEWENHLRAISMNLTQKPEVTTS